MSVSRPWLASDEDHLRTHYISRGAQLCAADLGRSVAAVSQRVHMLGLVRHARWTDAEDARLIAGWGVTSIEAIANALGRSPYAVYRRAAHLELGVGCPQGHEYLTQAARRCGYEISTMRRIVRWAHYPIYRAVVHPQWTKHQSKWAKHYVETCDVDDAVARWCATETLHGAAVRLGVSDGLLADLLAAASASGDRRVGTRPSTNKHWRVPSVVCDEFVRAYLDRETVADAERRTGHTQETLSRWLRESGFELKPRARLDPADIDRVVAARLADPKCHARRAA